MTWNPTPPIPNPPGGGGGGDGHPPPRDPHGGGPLGGHGEGWNPGGISAINWGDNQQSAFDQMALLLDQLGLSSLLGFLRDMILGGVTDAASLQLALQDRPEWKKRFAGNEMLKAQGLGVLSPGEYLAMERSYAQVMKMYGLPKGFYDSPEDYAKWIGGNVSVNELQQRVAAYSDLALREDPGTVEQLRSMGLGHGELLAYLIDPTKSLPVIQNLYKTTLLGAAARRAGHAASNKYLAQLASRGVTEEQAGQGYGLISETLNNAYTLAGVYGEDYGSGDLEAEIFDHNGQAAKKRKRMASAERSAFAGRAGSADIGRSTSGSY